jgi:hypothetical protein
VRVRRLAARTLPTLLTLPTDVDVQYALSISRGGFRGSRVVISCGCGAGRYRMARRDS